MRSPTLTSEQAEAAQALIQADYVAKEISGTIYPLLSGK